MNSADREDLSPFSINTFHRCGEFSEWDRRLFTLCSALTVESQALTPCTKPVFLMSVATASIENKCIHYDDCDIIVFDLEFLKLCFLIREVVLNALGKETKHPRVLLIHQIHEHCALYSAARTGAFNTLDLNGAFSFEDDLTDMPDFMDFATALAVIFHEVGHIVDTEKTNDDLEWYKSVSRDEFLANFDILTNKISLLYPNEIEEELYDVFVRDSSLCRELRCDTFYFVYIFKSLDALEKMGMSVYTLTPVICMTIVSIGQYLIEACDAIHTHFDHANRSDHMLRIARRDFVSTVTQLKFAAEIAGGNPDFCREVTKVAVIKNHVIAEVTHKLNYLKTFVSNGEVKSFRRRTATELMAVRGFEPNMTRRMVARIY